MIVNTAWCDNYNNVNMLTIIVNTTAVIITIKAIHEVCMSVYWMELYSRENNNLYHPLVA